MTNTEIAPITRLDGVATEALLTEKHVRNTLMGTLSAALREVVGTDEAVFYGRPLTESQINNLRTTMQRQDIKISVHRVRHADTDGHLITAQSSDQATPDTKHEAADL